MDNISIKKATLEDINLILPLVKSMINYQSAIEPSTLRSADEIGTQDIKDHVVNLLSNKSISIFYAKNETEILGYVMGQIDQADPDQKIARVGKIIDLFVLPEFRGKEIGTRLQNHLLEWFRGEKISRVELSVYSKNMGAISVWEKLGFQEFRRFMFKEI